MEEQVMATTSSVGDTVYTTNDQWYTTDNVTVTWTGSDTSWGVAGSNNLVWSQNPGIGVP